MKKRSFTLVEIMIVVAIIGLLAAIAVPNFVRSRNASRANVCIQNLRQMDHSKEQYAIENNAGEGSAVADADITPYIKGGAVPTCPAGGTYTLGNIGTDPACDYVDANYPHSL